MNKIDIRTTADYKQAYRSALISLYDLAEAMSGIDGMTPRQFAALTAAWPADEGQSREAYWGANDAYSAAQDEANLIVKEELFMDDLVKALDDLLLDTRCGEI